jgi:hypothetical protein
VFDDSRVGAEPGSLLLAAGVEAEECRGEGRGRLLALLMAALRTCARLGLIPQARHGGRGVCALAEAGSKFEGTGLEKLHIVHTHVAVDTAGGSEGGRPRASPRAGDCVPSPRGEPPAPTRACREPLFGGLGTMVILADDFRNPA